MKKVFHYTSLTGFNNIVEKNELWATQLEFMSDWSEGRFFKNFLHQKYYKFLKTTNDEMLSFNWNALPSFLSSPHSDALAGANARIQILDALLEDHFRRFVISFSGHETDTADKHSENAFNEGSLSQWRGYGVDGGIRIEFDLEQVSLKVDELKSKFSGAFVLSDAKYISSTDEVSRFLLSEEDNFASPKLSDFLNSYVPFKGGPLPEGIVGFLDSTFSKAPFLKDIEFSEEGELRFMACPFSKSVIAAEKSEKDCLVPEISYRVRAGKLIPYLPLFRGSVRQMISGILVGPGRYSEQNLQSAKSFLKKFDLDPHCVRQSRIPFELD